MFMADIAFGTGLVALTLGTGLVVWAAKSPGKGDCLAKTIGYIVMILAILTLICTGFSSYRMWKAYRHGMPPQHGGMMQMDIIDLTNSTVMPAGKPMKNDMHKKKNHKKPTS